MWANLFLASVAKPNGRLNDVVAVRTSSCCSEPATSDKVGGLREVGSLQESDPLEQTARRLTTF